MLETVIRDRPAATPRLRTRDSSNTTPTYAKYIALTTTIPPRSSSLSTALFAYWGRQGTDGSGSHCWGYAGNAHSSRRLAVI